MTAQVGLTEDQIAVLADASYVEFSREEARWSGSHGDLVERDGVLLFAAGSDFPVSANGVVRLDPTVPAATVIDAAESWFGAKGRGYSLTTNGHLGDQDLGTEAEARGLLRIMDTPAMVCDARLPDRTPPDGVEVRTITDAAGLADFIAINDAAYQTLGMPAGVIADMLRDPARILAPHVHTLVAYEGDRPLAAAQVMLSHGIGGVYYVGVIEEARGRGLADLITASVTNLGFDLGAAFVTLQASSMGDPVYRKMGYREVYRYTTHTRFV